RRLEGFPELVADADLADQLGGVVVDEAAADAGGHQSLVVEAAEAVLLIAATAMPERVAGEVVAGLAGSFPALGRGVVLAAHIQPGKAHAVLPGLDLARQADARVRRARVAVAVGDGKTRLALAGPLRGRGERG